MIMVGESILVSKLPLRPKTYMCFSWLSFAWLLSFRFVGASMLIIFWLKEQVVGGLQGSAQFPWGH